MGCSILAFQSILGILEAFHLQASVVRPFGVVQHEAKASHYISEQPLELIDPGEGCPIR